MKRSMNVMSLQTRGYYTSNFLFISSITPHTHPPNLQMARTLVPLQTELKQ